MGKKRNISKKQPQGNGIQQSETDNETICPHLHVSPAQCQRLKKLTSISCQECDNPKHKRKHKKSSMPERSDRDIWVCFHCGRLSCGGDNTFNHALQHSIQYKTHSICCNWKTCQLRCLQCNRDLKVTDAPEFDGVKKCLDILRKHNGAVDKDTHQSDTLPNEAQHNSDGNDNSSKDQRDSQGSHTLVAYQQKQYSKKDKNDEFQEANARGRKRNKRGGNGVRHQRNQSTKKKKSKDELTLFEFGSYMSSSWQIPPVALFELQQEKLSPA